MHTWDQLSRLDAGSWHSRAHAGEPLVRLEALARWLQALGLMVNLEIKPTKGEDARTGRVVAQRVARLWADAEIKPLPSSFSVDALAAARDAQPELPRALLLDYWPQDAVDMARDLGCQAVVAQHNLLDAVRIEAMHRAGFKVLTYTVNDGARARSLWTAGLDGLITDRVDLFEPQARLGGNPVRWMQSMPAAASSLSIEALIADGEPEVAPVTRPQGGEASRSSWL
mgnify:CR=1 FL=1